MAFLTRYGWLVAILLFTVQARADDTLQLAEQEIKAGMLYNFLKYTDWPEGAGGSIAVCIVGGDGFATYLQPMAGRTVNQRGIVIRRIKELREALACQLVFIDANEKDRWPKLRDLLKGKPVLTVSDFADFSASGGMIEFGRRNNHISVDLSMEAVTAAQLRMQDRLLRLVTLVHPEAQ